MYNNLYVRRDKVKNIKELYDLFYSPIVTPYNLLENVRLPNYTYVNYYKENDSVIAEMKCTPENSDKEIIFYYYFDSQDHLTEIYKEKVDVQKKELVYSRDNEQDKAIKSFNVKKENNKISLSQ